MNRDASQTAPKTQTAPSRGPPGPPKKTARGLQDQPGEPANEGVSKFETYVAVTNARLTWSELLVLNGGGSSSKREDLETSLDRSILMLSNLAARLKKSRSKDLKIVVATLLSIRDYRLRFPRSDMSNHGLSERARDILNELK